MIFSSTISRIAERSCSGRITFLREMQPAHWDGTSSAVAMRVGDAEARKRIKD
jgi:tRNA(Phe) wybutosine-synthesizing methylase Tyw3